MPRSVPGVQVDAFPARPFGAHPPAVVLDADGLSTLDRQRIAAGMNVVRVGGEAVTALTGGSASTDLARAGDGHVIQPRLT